MERFELEHDGIYRVTGSGAFQGVSAVGVYEGDLGGALIFRNLEEDPTQGFRMAQFIYWPEIGSIVRGTETQGEEE